MQPTPGSELSKISLQYLPQFASFLLNEHTTEFLKVSYRLLSELKVPVFDPLSESEAEALSDKSATELLTALANNDPTAHIEKAIDRRRLSQLPKVIRNMTVVDDVTRIGYSRKLALMEFIPKYTNNPRLIIDLIKEIDKYILEYTSTTFNAFIGIIDERIEEHVQSLEQRTRELIQSNANLEEFAFVASHDLKEPLRKISIFIDRLAALNTITDGEASLYMGKIQLASKRMSRMIDDLLSLSQISSNKIPEHVSLQELLNEVLITFEQRIEETKAVIESDNLPEISVIKTQFLQVLQNLISNSLKFVKPGVRPQINITHRYLGSDNMEMPDLPSASRYLELTFTDNGIGFDNEFKEKIFAVFQRLHQKHEYDGTGIGLSICKKIINNHGGTITAASQAGRGATFVITLPVD
jgi:signal transduction histidine kinase